MRIRKYFCYISITIIFIFTLLLLGYFTPRKSGNYSRKSCSLKICVFQTGMHSNIIVFVKNKVFDWQKYFYLNNNNLEYRYLGFGWGERNYYTNPPTKELKIPKGFQALFFPNRSVIRVQRHQILPQQVELECVGVSQSDYLELIEFINSSFKLSDRGEKILVAYNPRSTARFYEAKGTYSILKNSNSWTATGLRTANVNTPLWAGLASAIMFHLKGHC